MNGVIRSTFKLTSNSGIMNVLRQGTKLQCAKKRMYTTFSNICMKSAESNVPKSALLWNKNEGRICKVSKVSNDLAEFLEQEITAEQQLQKTRTIPSKIDDFEVKLNGSEVTLIKQRPDETIEIHFNVNHSVNVPDEEHIDENQEQEYTEMKSKPSFDIDIKRGDTTLGLNCSYTSGEPQLEGDLSEDIFTIDELTLYKGEWKDENYSVSGDILDGYLYDLLMNLLDEKGVTNEFVDKMSELATAYEHSSYISLLRDLKKFTSS